MKTLKKILIVDDEEEILELLKTIFLTRDYEVTGAESGNRAFEVFKDQEFDVVLSDVRMQNGTGIELLKKIKGSDKSCSPVVLLTGYSDVSKADSVALAAHTVLNKPIDVEVLLDAVSEAMDPQPSDIPISVNDR